MHSILVVTSWWSNCLGLTCLHKLVDTAEGRDIYLMQAGKSEAQMDRFRELMPPQVQELVYPVELPADDSRMREYLALTLFKDEDGAWFIDHDAFFHEPASSWFNQADYWFAEQGFALCTAAPREGPGLTQPAYWLSPRRWPEGLSSFDPIPFQEKEYVRRPDLLTHDGDLIQPQKDTLVQVKEELAALNLAGTFPLTTSAGHPLDPFPRHTHLGGIHVYTAPLQPTQGGLVVEADQMRWMMNTVDRFEQFFASCQPEWLAAEEPELLRRHHALEEWRDGIQARSDYYENFQRQDLAFRFDRRQLFTNVGLEYQVIEGESRGGIGVKLAELGSLPDEELAPLVPQIRPECRILVEEPYILAQKADEPEPIKLFEKDLATLCAFNGINGRNPLTVIGQQVAQQMHWTPRQGFAFARGFFLHLVQLNVAVPRVDR